MDEVNSNEGASLPRPPSDPGAIGTGAALRALLTALANDVRRVAARLRPVAAAKLAAFPLSRRPVRLGSAIVRAFKSVALLLLACAAGLAALAVWSVHDVPFERVDTAGQDAAIVIEAANGEPLGRRGPLRLADVPREGFPDHLVAAVVSIEDRRFYSHWGVDPRAVLRSLHRNIAAGKVVEGGSTITQQLVKQMLDDDERTFRRKGREALVAIWLEFQLSKDEIVTRYLNRTYMGAGAYGMPAAARLYFSKDVGELTLAESALLAGAIRSPSQLNPLRNLAAARERASLVLATMVENGFIDSKTAEAARAQPATPAPAAIRSEDGGWFADWIAEEAIDLAGSAQARGLRVRTTLVPAIQAIAERVVREVLDQSGTESRISQAALVALAPDGAVLAMVGGRDYSASQFNRAVQAARQPGSAFKPFVYLAALRQRYSLDDVVEDAPIDVDGWRPENFGDYRGHVTLSEAFARSLNTAAVRLALAVGIDEVARAAGDLGIDAPLTGTPSLALGASEVSLLDLTGAYASFRAGEAPIEPWGIAAFGAEGQPRLVTTGPSANKRRPIGAQHGDMIALLRNVVAHGTGRAAALPGFAAGKTGTSQNHRDAWFIGFNEAMVVGVWVGNDDGEPMNEITGGSVPSVIWRNFMMEAAPLVDDRQNRLEEQVVALNSGESASGRCDYHACSAQYRSFRASDCSYQPYGGGQRRVCPLGQPDAAMAGVDLGLDMVATEGALPSQEFVTEAGAESFAEPVVGSCDVAACAAKYSSFRASDCTYQPFDGPRRVCGSAEAEFGGPQSEPGEVVKAEAEHPPAPPEPRRLFGGLFSFLGGGPRSQPADSAGGCNFDACAAKYSSFDPASCSYQPLDGGPRRACAE
jgi:1A family penicillin-binding protein